MKKKCPVCVNKLISNTKLIVYNVYVYGQLSEYSPDHGASARQKRVDVQIITCAMHGLIIVASSARAQRFLCHSSSYWPYSRIGEHKHLRRMSSKQKTRDCPKKTFSKYFGNRWGGLQDAKSQPSLLHSPQQIWQYSTRKNYYFPPCYLHSPVAITDHNSDVLCTYRRQW